MSLPAGTIVCGVTDTREGRDAAELAGALGARLGLRVVLVHVAREGAAAAGAAEQAVETVAQAVGRDAETRVAWGGWAEELARVAAEEGADLIVVGSRPSGLRGSGIRCGLARELEETTPVPVVVAPPSTRRRSGERLAVAFGAGPR